jgi:hypothetical protein
MSRATPRKTKGAAGGPRPRADGARVDLPPRPPGPRSRRSRWSRRVSKTLSAASCAVPSLGRRVSGFCGRRWLPASGPSREMVPTRREKPAALRPTPSDDAPHQADPRLRRLWFALLAGSTRCDSRPSRAQPIVPLDRPWGARRALVTAVVTCAPPEPPFGVGPRPLRNSSDAAAATRIIVGVVSLCFSFAFPF